MTNQTYVISLCRVCGQIHFAHCRRPSRRVDNQCTNSLRPQFWIHLHELCRHARPLSRRRTCRVGSPEQPLKWPMMGSKQLKTAEGREEFTVFPNISTFHNYIRL